MRIRSLVVLAAASVALLAPLAPAQAVYVGPCEEPGEVGVVVYDDDGRKATVCYRVTD